jgi:hypothetical protein
MTEVCIANVRGEIVAIIAFDGGQLRCEGKLPDNLTLDDLKKLGFIYYETDARGHSVSKVKEVAACDSMEYLRALTDALPPGYFLTKVSSPRIAEEQRIHREAFERELNMLDEAL